MFSGFRLVFPIIALGHPDRQTELTVLSFGADSPPEIWRVSLKRQ